MREWNFDTRSCTQEDAVPDQPIEDVDSAGSERKEEEEVPDLSRNELVIATARWYIKQGNASALKAPTKAPCAETRLGDSASRPLEVRVRSPVLRACA
jgi:hypothetical protein